VAADLKDQDRPEKSSSWPWLRISVWSITAFAGFLEVWAQRFWLSPDATNYLGISIAYLRGDWKSAIDGYWSPFFSWLLALTFWLFHPSPYWESTVLHLLSLVALLVSLLTFEFFFRTFLRLRNQDPSATQENETLPDSGWWALGYALFLSTSLLVLTASVTTPDLWVAAWTYLIAGLLLRIRISGGRPYLFAALGFALACAYLTKAFYFPLSFVFLITAWLCAGNPKKTAKHAILGFAVFILVAGPWVAALSRVKGRFTFGDAGTMNFAMMIDELPRPGAWQGENGTGTPKHPVRQLLSQPHIYEYARPISESRPLSFDWSYWMEGIRPRFRLIGLLKVLRQSSGTFFQILLLQIECAVGLFALLFLPYQQSARMRPLFREWYLWAPPSIACLAYVVVHVESRLVAPFVLLCWISGFSCVLSATAKIPKRVALAVVFAVLAVIGLRVAKNSVSNLAAALAKQENVDWQVSQSLQQMGLHPGDKVSNLGLTGRVNWARLASLTVISEIPFGDEKAYWTATPQEKLKVLQLLAGTGAIVLITADPPFCAVDQNWIPLGNTGFYARRLPQQPPNP
jgi:4-amino-4-deoxy-L-arabinose transferase-like glycosyltransferase